MYILKLTITASHCNQSGLGEVMALSLLAKIYLATLLCNTVIIATSDILVGSIM